MNRGERVRPAVCVWLAILSVVMTAALGCNRNAAPALVANVPTQGSPSATSSAQDLPFNASDDKSEGISPTESLIPPPHRVPVGTPIIVRLQSGVSSGSAHPGDNFTAVLDEPIIVGSQTLVPRGARVIGKVVAAKPAGELQDPGYLRLALASISVNGKSFPLQSSSISVKGKSHEKHNWESMPGAAPGVSIGSIGDGKGALLGTTAGAAGATGFGYAPRKKNVGFGAERRLTFRLTGALDVKG